TNDLHSLAPMNKRAEPSIVRRHHRQMMIRQLLTVMNHAVAPNDAVANFNNVSPNNAVATNNDVAKMYSVAKNNIVSNYNDVANNIHVAKNNVIANYDIFTLANRANLTNRPPHINRLFTPKREIRSNLTNFL